LAYFSALKVTPTFTGLHAIIRLSKKKQIFIARYENLNKNWHIPQKRNFLLALSHSAGQPVQAED
jgi:hypothetical protein